MRAQAASTMDRSGAPGQRKRFPAHVKWTRVGLRTVRSVIDGQKTSVVMETNSLAWVRQARPGTAFELRAVAYATRVEQCQVSALVRVRRACRHQHLGEIPACGQGHEAARIRPHEPLWMPVLESALTRGGRLKLTEAEQEARQAVGWTLLDFELIDSRESRLKRDAQPYRNVIEAWLAEDEARFRQERIAAGSERQSVPVSEDERTYRIRSSAYTKRLGEVLAAGGDPTAITMDELDLAAAEARLEEKERALEEDGS